jgi:peptidoglycan hydrolase-like protein with peptidoglycan-binding domain
MKSQRTSSALRWITLPAVLFAALAGTVAGPAWSQGPAAEEADPFRRQARQMTAGPSAGAPNANMTSFATPLRCMDGLFRTYGAKGVSVLIEDIPDATSKVKVGAKDMFVSATSQMTRASRAIRLIPWVSGGVIHERKKDQVLASANFAVQGSITQFDESMLRKQRDGAVCLGPLCIGGAESDSFSGMSLDLNVIEAEGLTLIPGVTSKNVVLVRRKGNGVDGDLSLKKFGIQYNFTLTSSDAQGQALRTLIELSVIELYGRLLKIPYWSCLGLSDTDAGVALEIEDWWETLRGDIPSLVSYLQIQMQARGLYKGEVDGQLGEEIRRAIRAYRLAMGLPGDLNLDLEFFRKYLAADHQALQAQALGKLAEINARERAAAVGRALGGRAPELSVLSGRGDGRVHRRGEPVEVEVRVAGDGYLYCYIVDDERRVSQLFPNDRQASAAVRAHSVIVLPGDFGFRLFASRRGAAETIACFSTTTDLGKLALGEAVIGGNLQTLRSSLSGRAGADLRMGVIDVKVR